MVGGGVRLEERLDVVGLSPVHRLEGQYQGLASDAGCDGRYVDRQVSRGGSIESNPGEQDRYAL